MTQQPLSDTCKISIVHPFAPAIEKKSDLFLRYKPDWHMCDLCSALSLWYSNRIKPLCHCTIDRWFRKYFPAKTGRIKPPNLLETWKLDSNHFMKMSKEFLLCLLPPKPQMVSTFLAHPFHLLALLTRCLLFLLLFFLLYQ